MSSIKHEKQEEDPPRQSAPPLHTEDSAAGSTEFLEALIHHGSSKKQGSAFLEKLYEILMDNQYENYICWCADGRSILIKRVEDFSQIVLPRFYKHNNFQSFVRQLNMYNFTKTSHDANRREFKQPLFRKGKRNLLPLICRKTQKALRSIDSVIDCNDANSLIVDVAARSELLSGKPLERCKSTDSSTFMPGSDTSPLWGVVHELRSRVNALEVKLDQVSKGKNRAIYSNNTTCASVGSNEIDGISNPYCESCNQLVIKKLRSNSDKPVSSTGASDDNVHVNNVRPRSVSFGSYESLGSTSTSVGKVENNRSTPRPKRGVDAILSAAEILHDKVETNGKNSFVQKSSTNISATENKRVRKIVEKNSVRDFDAASSRYSSSTDPDGLDSTSDSSSSPLYFQDTEHISSFNATHTEV